MIMIMMIVFPDRNVSGGFVLLSFYSRPSPDGVVLTKNTMIYFELAKQVEKIQGGTDLDIENEATDLDIEDEATDLSYRG